MTDQKEDKPMSTPAQAPAVIEGPETQSRAVLRREPVPSELAELGVKLGVDGDSGMQMLIIPKALRQKANVLTPVQAFQQADPNWRPSLRIVELNPSPEGEHFYKQGKNLAPRKQALELLADAAGVVDTRIALIGRERVIVGDVAAETFTHVATAKIRKSDGTMRTLEASRTYEPFAEYEEIRTSVGSGNYAKAPGTPEYDAEVRKRWLNEIKFAKAKNESKAILRAIRAALQIPHTFSAADAQKPFVVVGWNLAPQDSAAVQAAIAELYGATPSTATAALTRSWGDPDVEIEQDDTDLAFSESGSDPQAPAVAADPPLGDAGVPGDNTPEEDVEPEIEEPEILLEEPEVEAEAALEVDPQALAAAMQAVFPSGAYQKRSIEWLLAQGEKADEWVSYALSQPWPQDRSFHDAMVVAAQVHRPALYAKWQEANI